jgi:hypothetical protein
MKLANWMIIRFAALATFSMALERFPPEVNRFVAKGIP